MTTGAREEIRRGPVAVDGLWAVIDRLAPVLLALLALAPRFYRLGAQSFWFDEAQTLFVAQFPWAEIVQRAYRPPLYHLLLNVWSGLVPGSEFWLRLPSAFAGVAVPPLLFAIAARLYHRRVAWTAGLLAVASPTLIAYSQELRMYSLMAAAFALLLYLMVVVVQRPRPKILHWVAIVITTSVSLYTHYFAIPFLLCAAGVIVVTLALQRRWSLLRRWIAVQVAAAIGFIPWLMVIRGGRGGTDDYVAAEVLPVLPDVPGVRAFVMQTWLFYTTGPVTSDLPLVRQLAVAVAILAAAALAVLLAGLVRNLLSRSDDGRQAVGRERLGDLWMLALVGLTTVGAALMYYLRPGVVHPRHLMMLAVPLLILMARVVEPALALFAPGQRRWSTYGAGLLAGSALLALGTLFLLSYQQSVRDPVLQRADVRGMAQLVTARSTPDTVILLPHHDYALEHYLGNAAAIYHLETRVGDSDLLPWLLPRIEGAQRAIFIDWVHLHQDPRDLISWFLQRNGRLVERFWTAERWVSVYDLEPTLANPAWEPLSVHTDAILLKAIALPDAPAADQTLAIGLEWELVQPVDRDLKASVRLVDPTGHVVAADDRVLLTEQATVGTSRWSPGRTARNYYLLHLPVGTPPLDYAIQLSVYDSEGATPFGSTDGGALGSVLTIGEVSLAPASALPADYYDTLMTRVEQVVAPGLELVGYALGNQEPRAGETLAVTLYWRALADGLPAYEPELTLLSDGGDVLSAQLDAPAYGQYPTTQWRAGELVVDRRLLRVAPEANAGSIDIVLSVKDESFTLAAIQIRESDRLFELPPLAHSMDETLGGIARLAGYAIEESPRADGAFTVTLYWEALLQEPTQIEYAVFVHLLDDGDNIIAQHDGPPAGGAWPTTTWVPGQIIVGTHELAPDESGYRGTARLAVGMYDATSWQRLATPNGVDRILLSTSVTLD